MLSAGCDPFALNASQQRPDVAGLAELALHVTQQPKAKARQRLSRRLLEGLKVNKQALKLLLSHLIELISELI